jgi:hypothetical protein
MRYVLSILVYVLSVTFVVATSHAVEKNKVFILCERQKDVRWIRVFSSNDGKCKTVYSKDGFSQVVSSATFFSSCESVLNNVRKNVEGGGFKCKEAALAQVIEIQ